MAVPKEPKAGIAFSSTDGYAIWMGSKYQDGTWDLVKYLTGEECQGFLTGATGYFPSRTSVIADWQETLTE